MHLSPTSLGAWTQCERLYQGLYVDRLKFKGVRLPAMRSTWAHRGIAGVLGGSHFRAVAAEMATGFAADFRASKMVDAFGMPIIHHQAGSVLVIEQAALVEAVVLAWTRTRLPAMAGWRVLQTERVSTLALGQSRFHDTVEFQIKPDWVLMDDTKMVIRPFDVKLASTIDQEWLDQWQVSPQSFWYHYALARLFPAYKVEPLWIEAVDIGRAGKLRHNSPLIYAHSAQTYPPYDEDLIFYENAPRRAQLFRAWSPEDTKLADPLARHVERIPDTVLAKRFVSVEGVPPQMAAPDVDQMFGDVLKIADQIEARKREGAFRWTGLMSGHCATPYNRCPFYRRCYRVDDWEKWYETRAES